MNLATSYLHELQHEAAKTLRYLQVIPPVMFSYKPHKKSMSLLQLSTHIAELPGWVTYTIDADELDFETMNYQPPEITSLDQLLQLYSENLNRAVTSLQNATDETMQEIWRLRNGKLIILEMPRAAVLRDMVFNHLIHHRGQLSVYLRLLDVKLPGLYGPSADEMEEDY